MSGEASSSLSSAEGVGKLSAFSSSSRGRSSTDLPDAGDSPTVSSTGTTPRKLMAGVRRVPSSQPKTSRVSPSPTKNSLSPADLMAIPGRNEILRLENELKLKEMDLAKALSEGKALKLTNASMERAVSSLSDENSKLKERLRISERLVESKNLELKEVNNARKKAIADKEAAELTTRRLQAAWKDHDDTALLAAKAAVEDQLKLAEKEMARLREDASMLDRQNKTKERALVDAEIKVEAALAKAARVEELENLLVERGIQLETSQGETRTVDTMYKQKVAEVKLLSDKCDELQEALTQAQGLQNTVRDLERQLEQQQMEQRVIEEECARAKVAATRVAMVVANEWKDDNDKVITVKQWLEERKMLMGEISRTKDKLAQAERSAKYEAQMKLKSQSRLKAIEDTLKSGKAYFAPSPRGVRATTGGSSPSPMRNAPFDEEAASNDSPQVAEGQPGDDKVSAVLYDALVKEVFSLRKASLDRENLLKDKESTNEMLTKKVELLMRAMEVDQRKHGREISALKEELSTLKAELGTRGPRRSTASPRAARS